MPLQFYNLLQQLNNTPDLLKTWITGISEEILLKNEGPNFWSSFDALEHLVLGGKPDWIPRLRIILFATDKTIEPFDCFIRKRKVIYLPPQKKRQ
jgi:hypothetical protein